MAVGFGRNCAVEVTPLETSQCAIARRTCAISRLGYSRASIYEACLDKACWLSCQLALQKVASMCKMIPRC
jgi:hypothetical protein